MKLTVIRRYKKEGYTIGDLYIDGTWFSNTLEDEVRELNTIDNKIYGETAIPEGTYEIKLSYSPRFKKILPEVLDVPFFTGIRIHAGNTAKDSEGCILVGENKARGKVLNSRKTMERLMKILKSTSEPIILQIF